MPNVKQRYIIMNVCRHLSLFLMIIFTRQIQSRLTPDRKNSKCSQEVADLVIALDSSFSIRQSEFEMQLSFIKSLIDSFHLSSKKMQVGIISFGSNVHLEFKLNRHRHHRSFKRAVDRIKHLNSGTNTHKAVRYAHTNMFSHAFGGRQWAKKKLVLITDGLASNVKKTLHEAAKAKKKGIEVFYVTIGDSAQGGDMEGVASLPTSSHLFYVRDYSLLPQIKTTLTDAACERRMKDEAPDMFQEKCRDGKADILFLLDSSNSVYRPDFYKYIGLLRHMVSSFTLSQEYTRIGLAVYSDRPITVLSLTDTQSRSHVNRVLDNIEYIPGSSNTAHAIRYVRKNGYLRENDRRRVPKMMVIFTDGHSDNPTVAKRESNAAKRAGIKVFTVSVGTNTNLGQMAALSSQPSGEYMAHVDTITHLDKIGTFLLSKTCTIMQESKVNDAPVTPTPCSAGSTDVLFLYNSKSLSEPNYNLIANIIASVKDSDVFTNHNFRFGVVRGSPANFTSLKSVWGADFKSQTHNNSKTSLHLLLGEARKLFEQEKSSNSKTIILFIHSRCRHIFQTVLASSLLKRSGVRILVVAIGTDFNERQLVHIASHSIKDNLLIQNRNQLDHNGKLLVQTLSTQLCFPPPR